MLAVVPVLKRLHYFCYTASLLMFYLISLFQLSIKQELKMAEALAHVKKDKKVKDLSMSPKKKKRKQRSPAKV